ncbi:MAG: transglycosylase SLT domain-containing protein [Bacteroidaceae bacterium]|nr:transglycosylase SLT domain-containing protein [Bacteroidaceae bacterium]
MKKYLLIAIALVSVCTQLRAQNKITVYDEKKGENEVIDIPEIMTYDLDSMLNEWSAKSYLKTEGECFMKSENPFFEKEVYMKRLEKMPTLIEMPYNNVVQKFIDMYCTRLRRSVSYMLGASNLYMPIFEEALDEYNLPLELKYLPIIESALNPRAVSHAGAAGLWQFMVTTGKKYGLKKNSLLDERCDPIKSSYAAAHYLKDLYDIYGNWSLVIAAYNCGPGTINKAIHRAGGVRDYWQIYNYLPQETRGYVPAFIAANYVMTYYCDHNICPIEARDPMPTDTIMVNKNLHLKQVAEICKTDINLIRSLNPQYRADIIPGSSDLCSLRLPQNDLYTFIDAGDSIYSHKADELLSNRNVVEDKNTVVEHSSSRKAKGRKARQARARGGRSHTIKQGETLSDLARRYGTTVKKLQRLNGIKGTNIREGKKIKVK